jgi:hypothetical protein
MKKAKKITHKMAQDLAIAWTYYTHAPHRLKHRKNGKIQGGAGLGASNQHLRLCVTVQFLYCHHPCVSRWCASIGVRHALPVGAVLQG